MNRALPNLQDAFLNHVRREGIPVTVYLVNGYQMKGAVKGFDSFTIMLTDGAKQDLVYKHAISTITASRPLAVELLEAQDAAGEVVSQGPVSDPDRL